MRVYRIEGSGGKGPYQWSDRVMLDMGISHGRVQGWEKPRPAFGDLLDNNQSFNEWIIKTHGQMPKVHGCESLDQLLWWFEYDKKQWLEHMAERDFSVCIYEVADEDAWVGGNQVVFVRNRAMEIDRVKLSDLL